jgi:hypothetical protein
MIFGLALAGAYSRKSSMISHGYECTFRHSDGSMVTISSHGFATRELARADVRDAAVRLGYRTPRWWEFWRYKESSMLFGADEEAEAAKEKAA